MEAFNLELPGAIQFVDNILIFVGIFYFGCIIWLLNGQSSQVMWPDIAPTAEEKVRTRLEGLRGEVTISIEIQNKQ